MDRTTSEAILRQVRRMASSDPEGVSDGQLLQRFVEGHDETAFELLFWRHQRMVYSVCRQVLSCVQDAEDAFQATFLILAQKASSIRQRGTIAGWLHRVAYRTALRVRAMENPSTSIHTATGHLLAETVAESDQSPAKEAVQREEMELLHREIARLPEKYRAVVVLCALEGVSCTEAAAKLGWPRGTVATRLAKARKMLHSRLLRRGIVTVPAGFAALLGGQQLHAATSLLLHRTIAITKSAGAGADVSSRVAALVKGALFDMFFSKCKILVGFLAAAVLLCVGGAFLAFHSSASETNGDKEARALAQQVVLADKEPREENPQAENKDQKIEKPLWDKPIWKRPLVQDIQEITGAKDPGTKAEGWLKDALLAQKNAPLIPGGIPLFRDQNIIYRNYYRLVARADRSHKLEGIEIKAGEIEWLSTYFTGSLSNLLSDGRYQNTIENWLNIHKDASDINFVYENLLVATLSSDGKRVYGVDDLAVPIPADQIPFLAPPFVGQRITAAIKELLFNNILYAYQVEDGKIAWRRGGINNRTNQLDPDLENSLFLGPPLAVDGKLYVLNEKNNGKLRLMRLEPRLGQIEKTLYLDTMEDRFYRSRLRRTNAVHLAAAWGILLCPTHAGKLFAVDLKQHKIRWTFSEHQPAKAKQPAKEKRYWHHAKPFIHDDRVIFTSPVDPAVWCLDLEKGTKKWRTEWEDGLYLAGIFDDTVLLVGPSSCRGLAVRDGKEKWLLPTGVPSGVGALHRGRYYLPLRKGAKSNQPEVCVLDVANGKILARLPFPKDDMPGNLVFTSDQVISQTALSIAAYPLQR